jgi:ABC-type phosphate transport system substrate-binding protein
MNSVKVLFVTGLAVAGAMVVADLAQAQTVVANGAGSSAGRQYAGLTPAFVCDPPPHVPTFFRSHENPPNRTEWQCLRGGVPHVYRYSASASADGYTKLPSGATATAPYLDLNACPATSSAQVGGRTVNQAICGSSATPAPSVNLVVHFGASDVKPSSFNAAAGGAVISPPAAGHLTATPIVAVPFSIVVGGGVTGANGVDPLKNLTQLEVRQILSGDVEAFGGDWVSLGHNTNSGNKAIVVCHRTVISGTLAALNQTVMQAPFAFQGINPIASPTNIFNASSSNVKTCVENNQNSIGYIDSDTVPNLLNGAYQVALDGFLPSNPGLGAGIAKTRDLRCGKYAYWTDWVIVTRNGGVEVAPTNAVAGTNNAITAYRTAAIDHNPLPEFWGATNDMFVAKNDDKGPHLFLPTNGNGIAASSVCGNTGSIQ